MTNQSRSLKPEDIKALVWQISLTMEKNKEMLTQLDTALGDGDLGISMTRAFKVADLEAAGNPESDPGKLLMAVGASIGNASPSMMGALLAAGFMRGGRAISGDHEIDLSHLAKFLREFVQGVMERGDSAPGHKTILDTLAPVATALESASAANKSLPEAAAAALEAGKEGLTRSTQMKATYGRAAEFQDTSIGKQDAGATVGLLIIESLCIYMQKKLK